MIRYLKLISGGLTAGALGLVLSFAQAQPVRPGGGGGSPMPGPMDPLGPSGAGQQPGAGRPTTPGPSGAGQIPGGNPAPMGQGQQRPNIPPRPGPLDKGSTPGERPMPPSGTTPAQPHPGEGRPSDPAIPGNPQARDSVQETPSRTGTTPSRTPLPANVTATSMVNGLTQVNIGTININNIQNNNIINVNGAMSNVQVHSLISSVQNNTQAATIAQQLTTRLIEARLLTRAQQVVGFQDGMIFVTGRGTAGAGANVGVGTGAGVNIAVSRDALLNGLVRVNLQNLNLQASNVVNVNTNLNVTQVQEVIDALNVNAEAKANSDKLTAQLMTNGMVQQGQQVVGVIGERIFVTGGTK
jgi:hypothetical protein